MKKTMRMFYEWYMDGRNFYPIMGLIIGLLLGISIGFRVWGC